MCKQGRVILVGAGPGDLGLLTMRGKEAIARAEVVLFDRLVSDEILDLIPHHAKRVDVGKNSGHHPVPQEEINRLILDYAVQGNCVVRLKGGDPYLFGRGAEELEAVIQAGIPFEVVPGISSAMAVPAYGGIPVTHREMASSVHIITGHPRAGAAPIVPYAGLAQLNGTLVFLMGVSALPSLTEGLMTAGMNPKTPAALIENGTRPKQRKVVSTLDRIAAEAVEQQFCPPSILIVGEVCTLSEQLDWYAGASDCNRPLKGARIIVTRPASADGTLTAQLRALGGDVLDYPCIQTQPLAVPQEVYDKLAQHDWIVLTSPVGAELFFQNLAQKGIDIRTLARQKFAAVGAKTAAALTERAILPALVPQTYNGETLAEEMIARVKIGEKILLYRAKQGNPALFQSLWNAGCIVEDVAAYETIFANPRADAVKDAVAAGKIDYVTFTSASTVQGFVHSLPGVDYGTLTGICIGKETAAAAQAHGFQVKISREASIESMIACILQERGQA